MKTLSSFVVLLLLTVMIGLIGFRSALGAGRYEFTVIAEGHILPTTAETPFLHFHNSLDLPGPSINEFGAVAFSARPRQDGINQGLYIGQGSETTLADYTVVIENVATSATDLQSFDLGDFTGSNVAFSAWVPTANERGIFASNGTSVQTLFLDPDPFRDLAGGGPKLPSLNRHGRTVFIQGADPDDGLDNHALMSAANNVRSLLYLAHRDPSPGSFQFINPGTVGVNPAINDDGQALFHADKWTGSGHFDTIRGLFRGSGGSATTIALEQRFEEGQGGFQIAGVPAGLNNQGQAAFVGLNFTPDGGSRWWTLHIGDGLTLQTLAQTTLTIAPQPGDFRQFQALAINDPGDVAFTASQWLEGDGSPTALFLLPASDASAQPLRLLGVGDVLFGSEVLALHFARGGLNDDRQIAFQAQLADGRRMIIRADPIGPGGDLFRWLGPETGGPGGTFHVDTHWQAVNEPDLQQVPVKNEERADTAIFDLPETYTVDFAGAPANLHRMIVTGGHVTLNDGVIDLRSDSLADASLVVGGSRLTLADSILESHHAVIGQVLDGRVDVVGDQTGWNNVGLLLVGEEGAGTLRIEDGGSVLSAETHIGAGPGQPQGIVEVFDVGSRLRTNRLDVTQGILHVERGGEVNVTGEVLIGKNGGAGHVVVRAGDHPGGPEHIDLRTGPLTVGHSGEGSLFVGDGGRVRTQGNVVVDSGRADDLRGVHITGKQPGEGGSSSSWHVTGSVRIGDQSQGRLHIENDGLLTISGNIDVDSGVLAGGLFVKERSRATVQGDLNIGLSRFGFVDVEKGGGLTLRSNLNIGVSARGLLDIGGLDDDLGLRATVAAIGAHIGIADAGSVLIRAGGLLNTHTGIVGGDDDEIPGYVLITGVAGEHRSTWLVHETLNVAGGGEIEVEKGGQLETKKAIVGGPGGSALVVIQGSDSVWTTEQLTVGLSGAGTVRLEDSTVEVGSDFLTVGSHGRIEGTGLLNALVRINGGYIAPGLSPGTLTIDGDYEQTGGVLEIEFAGLGAGQFDTLIVTGDATLGGTLELVFLGGFAPSEGDVLEFLTVGGDFTDGGFDIQLRNLAPGFEFETHFTDGAFGLTALNDAVWIPEPSALALLAIGAVLAAWRRRRAV